MLGVHWLGRRARDRALRAVVRAAGPRPRAGGAGRLAPAARGPARASPPGPLSLPAMDLGLNGRVALVTGASKGIGRGIAAELVAEGARVAISSRSRERIEATAAEIGATATCTTPPTSTTPRSLVAEVEQALGPIDVLVCNTGGPPGGPDPLGFTREQWQAAYRRSSSARWRSSRRSSRGCASAASAACSTSRSTGVREPIPNLMLSNAHRISMLDAFKTHRPPGRGRRRDAQHRPPRPHRHRPPGRAARLARGGRWPPRSRRSRPGGWAPSRSSRRSPSCSARRARATSRARRCAVDGGLLRSVF